MWNYVMEIHGGVLPEAGIILRAKDITILKTFNIFQILNNSIGLILKKLLN